MNTYRCCFLVVFLMMSNIFLAQEYYGKSKELPITAIKPEGWVKEFLVRQANGLAKYPHVSGYPFNTHMWTADIQIPVNHAGSDWWPYEQTGYYLDGILRAGYLVNDESLVEYVQKNLEHLLEQQDGEGILGPKGADDWSRVVFFRALMAEYDLNKDPKILKRLEEHYLKSPRLFNEDRGLLSIEQILWLYQKTGNQKLLELANNSFFDSKEGNKGGEYVANKNVKLRPSKLLDEMLSEKIPEGHGVSVLEQAKIPSILYLSTGEEKFLNASINQFDKIEKHHLLVDGTPSSVEHLSGKAANMAHETCDTSDLTWSAGYLLMATGDGHWADLIERSVFNAGMGALDKNFRAHQYYSAPNQPIAAGESSQFNSDVGWGGMAVGRLCYRTGHDTECCTGNIQRMMPAYVTRMWLKENNGIVAGLYGPSTVNFDINENKISIQEQTNYPFEDEITFNISIEKKSSFDFKLRIPAWCSNAQIFINGKKVRKLEVQNGFVNLKRKFSNNDKIVLKLPMEAKLTTWGSDQKGVAVERGPLVFSLPIKSRDINFPYIGDVDLDKFPNTIMYPDEDWAYQIVGKDIKVAFSEKGNASSYPWDLENTPIHIKVPVKKVKNWTLNKTHHAPIWPTDVEAEEEIKYLNFVPLGATYLRMTILPHAEN